MVEPNNKEDSINARKRCQLHATSCQNSIQLVREYTSYQTKQKLRLRRHDPDTRAQLALRFKAMYQSLGLDLPGCAQLLHVSERTLHNWACGKHDIPYATYRLLRLLNRMELPGQTWQGWSFHGHKLVSPEGHVFVGTDSAWWGLLVRRAAMFGKQRRVEGAAHQLTPAQRKAIKAGKPVTVPKGTIEGL